MPEIHIHHHYHPDTTVSAKLDIIIKNQNKMAGELDDLKAIATRQSAALAGVRKDVAYLKAKLEASPGGIDAAGVAELKTLFSGIADETEQLDAETNSDEETPTPETEG